MNAYLTRRAGRDDIEELFALFKRSEVSCYCRYFQFSGDKNAWLERCFVTPERNAEELRADLETATPDSPAGVVCRESAQGAVLGWMKLTRASRVPKLYEQRPYRKLPNLGADREGVFTVGCFLIDPAARQRGLCSELLSAGIRIARECGGTSLEAFPRRGDDLRDEQLLAGPPSVFVRHGFSAVHDDGPYPVLRLTL